MILVDASIWIDYINKGELELDRLLIDQAVLMHPHTLGEITLGSIKDRDSLLPRLLRLPSPWVVDDGHMLDVIERDRLWGTGIGYSDAHLLASTLLTPDTKLWTRDRRLHAQAERLDVAYPG